MNNKVNFDLREDIFYQISMILYNDHNSEIANINEHLGEEYSYQDLIDAMNAETRHHIKLLEEAIKLLQHNINKTILYCQSSGNYLTGKKIEKMLLGERGDPM